MTGKPTCWQTPTCPGPRGNLELAQAVAEVGTPGFFNRCLRFDPASAPVNHPAEFLVFCGVLGLGRLMAEGDFSHLPTLRHYASDPRWRTREAAAMALQNLGKHDLGRLMEIAKGWSEGSWLERRGAVAALAEPVLLTDPEHVRRVLDLFDDITASLEGAADRSDEAFRVLRQALGYAWSVVVAALPEEGVRHMESWLRSTDPDVHWVMKENLKKKRLERALPDWTAAWRGKMNIPAAE